MSWVAVTTFDASPDAHGSSHASANGNSAGCPVAILHGIGEWFAHYVPKAEDMTDNRYETEMMASWDNAVPKSPLLERYIRQIFRDLWQHQSSGINPWIVCTTIEDDIRTLYQQGFLHPQTFLYALDAVLRDVGFSIPEEDISHIPETHISDGLRIDSYLGLLYLAVCRVTKQIPDRSASDQSVEHYRDTIASVLAETPPVHTSLLTSTVLHDPDRALSGSRNVRLQQKLRKKTLQALRTLRRHPHILQPLVLICLFDMTRISGVAREDGISRGIFEGVFSDAVQMQLYKWGIPIHNGFLLHHQEISDIITDIYRPHVTSDESILYVQNVEIPDA